MTDPSFQVVPEELFAPAPQRQVAVGSIRELVIIAVLVFTGYYVGARVGLALTFYPSPISVLWPPNAILLAAMMLVPARLWWLVAVAALPAHLISELHAGIPVTMVLCWFVSNVAEALIGAFVLRALSATNPFTSPRGVIHFILAACVRVTIAGMNTKAAVMLETTRSDHSSQ